ncbi:Cell division protein kinase 9 [Paragonimus heterotremus]|uniref:Cell division protein kinase 9 n=1 Tax=Paragonimus heterotremus TaxID=100268 RepID=A0A8J4TA25_9TREM|nr:Cell division protein kinase 9 [Paragonimus heterotremus]
MKVNTYYPRAFTALLLSSLHNPSELTRLPRNNVLHRDLKTSNILIDRKGVLKIADFGLARLTVSSVRPDRPTRYTARVVTLWYRPPEILLNDRSYGRPVDLWGAGCIMAELWTRYPIMQV